MEPTNIWKTATDPNWCWGCKGKYLTSLTHFLMWLKQVGSQKWRCDVKMDRRCLFFNIWQSWDPVRVWWAAIPTALHSELLFSFPESSPSVISCPSPQMRQQSLHKLHCSHLKPNRCSAIPSRASFHPAWLLFKELISSQEVLVETSLVAFRSGRRW